MIIKPLISLSSKLTSFWTIEPGSDLFMLYDTLSIHDEILLVLSLHKE